MNRIDTFKSDAKVCIKAESLDNCQLIDFKTQDNTFTCKWVSQTTKRECLITYFASDDYPENGCIFPVWQGGNGIEENCERCSHPLLLVLMSLSAELKNKDEHMAGTEDNSTKLCSDQGSDLKLVFQERLDPMSDSDSEYSLDCTGCDDYDDDDDYNNHHFDPQQLMDKDQPTTSVGSRLYTKDWDVVHPLLRKDMYIFLESVLKGSTNKIVPTLKTRIFAELGEVDCDIHVALDSLNLSPQICNAWKLQLDEPLVIRINFDNIRYLDNFNPPKVEVFQTTKHNRNVLPQIQNILKLFLREIWDKKLISNKILVGAEKPTDGFLSTKEGNTSGAYAEIDSLIMAHNLHRMTEMGFDEHAAQNALECTSYDLLEACDFLSQQVERTSIDGLEDRPPNSPKQKKMKMTRSGSEPKVKHCEQALAHSSSNDGRRTEQTLSSSHTEPNLSKSAAHSLSFEPLSQVKQMPSLENGFIVMLYKYVCQRIPTLNAFCIVCDDTHLFRSPAMLMPAVCSRDLCVFGFQTLGVMANAEADIASGPEVVDLLITMARAACFSERNSLIFTPFPNIVDPDDHNKIAVSEKERNFEKAKDLMAKLPGVEEMMGSNVGGIHTNLDKIDRLLYPLLSWIIYSNRSHIVMLPQDMQFDFMNTRHQFMLLSSPPEQESEFQILKAKHGSTFAFHGSPIDNWHSIIRQGLIVASGTKFQLNGAAHGAAIYISPKLSLSTSYCRTNPQKKPQLKNQSRFLSTKSSKCMALCEVINSKVFNMNTNEVWTVKDKKHICTRFFFVWEDRRMPLDVDISRCDLIARVEQALASCFMPFKSD